MQLDEYCQHKEFEYDTLHGENLISYTSLWRILRDYDFDLSLSVKKAKITNHQYYLLD